jgi:transposase
MNEMDHQVVLALLQQSQEEILRLRKQLFAHDPSVLQESMDRMQTSMDDMLKTLHATQASHKETQHALNDATDQNRKLSSEMVKYMEFYMDERKQREALESENRRMKKLLELYHSNGATAEEVKIIKGKHFSRSSEKGKTSSVDVNRQEEEHDFDGTNPPKDVDSTTEPIATKNELDSKSRKQRIDHAKNTYGADEIVEHFSDMNVLPAGYRIIETRLVREFEHIEKVVEHRYHILRCVDTAGKIVDVYMPRDKQDLRMPGVETIKGCPATTGLLAKLITDKYQFHLPVERQVARLKMMGMDISKCTLNFWLQKGINKLTKLMPFLKGSLLAEGSHVFCDETSEMVCVEDCETQECHYRKKYVWGLVNVAQKCAYYLYGTGSRSRKAIADFLGDFTGSVMTDGYNVYRMFADGEPAERVQWQVCMAHVRRKFIEAALVDERSQCFVNLIGNLYWIESMIKLKQLSADETRKERKEKATSILIELKSRLQQIADDPLTVYSESLRKAVTYALTFWKQTTLYIEHGDWNIDNNTGERSMRPLAVGRKNFVGFGSHQGASLGACAYTLVETCKLNTISAYEYIKKVLTLIGDEKEDTNNYSDLIPSILTVK